jgi:hypothetical protein
MVTCQWCGYEVTFRLSPENAPILVYERWKCGKTFSVGNPDTNAGHAATPASEESHEET